MNIVVYGPEGSGKGTQARLLAEKLKLPIYTAGDLVREKAQNDKTALGNLCRKALTKGKYLSNQEMCQLIGSKLQETRKNEGFILDGFPRNKEQAVYLISTLTSLGKKLDKVVYLKLSDTVAMERLSKRKRKLFENSNILHDSKVRIKERLKAYREKEKELLPFLTEKNLILEIEANDKVENIAKAIVLGLQLRRG